MPEETNRETPADRASSIEEQLARDGYYVSTTSGWSMKPMLRDRRDRIVVRTLEAGERLKKYELPLYRRPDGKYVLHRVIGVKRDHYRIRGDNTYAVETVPDAWILGKVTEFYRNGKRIGTTSRRYLRYARIWNFLYPARRVWVGIRHTAGKIKRFLLPGGKKKNR